MKFGKRLALEAERSAGGAANFIDYASLKAAIKADAASKGERKLLSWRAPRRPPRARR
jgi:hypothetical protein